MGNRTRHCVHAHCAIRTATDERRRNAAARPARTDLQDTRRAVYAMLRGRSPGRVTPEPMPETYQMPPMPRGRAHTPTLHCRPDTSAAHALSRSTASPICWSTADHAGVPATGSNAAGQAPPPGPPPKRTVRSSTSHRTPRKRATGRGQRNGTAPDLPLTGSRECLAPTPSCNTTAIALR